MNDLLKVFLGCALLPVSIGYTGITLLFPPHTLTVSFRLALAYGLGSGLLALWIFVLHLTSIPFNVPNIALPLLLMIGLGWGYIWLQRDQLKAIAAAPTKIPNRITSPHNAWIWTLIALMSAYLLINSSYIFWRATHIPVYSWDAIATVAMKAKIFYFAQDIPPLKELPHPTYPLMTPLLQTWTALVLNRWHDQWIKFIFPLAALSYTALHYLFLRYFTSRPWALFGCVLLLSSNLFMIHATISYRDLILMTHNITTYLLLILWFKERQGGFLILAGLFAGFTTFTKLEGSAYYLIQGAVFLLMLLTQQNSSLKSKGLNAIQFGLPSLIIAGGYHLYKIQQHMTKDGSGLDDKLLFEFSLEKITTMGKFFSSFANNMFLSGNWHLLWAVLILSLLQLGHKEKRNHYAIRFLLVALSLFFGFYFVLTLLTNNYYWIVGPGRLAGLSRILFHTFPFVPLLIVLLNSSHEEQKYI